MRFLLARRRDRILRAHVRGVPAGTIAVLVGLPVVRVLEVIGGIDVVWWQGLQRGRP